MFHDEIAILRRPLEQGLNHLHLYILYLHCHIPLLPLLAVFFYLPLFHLLIFSLLVSIKDNNRLCNDSERPCYITSKKDELEGVIIFDFKNNIIAAHRLNEKDDYLELVRPDGIGVKLEDKEPKESLKKILKSMRK